VRIAVSANIRGSTLAISESSSARSLAEAADATLAVTDQYDDAVPLARSQTLEVVARQQQHLAGHDHLQQRYATQAGDAAGELSRGQRQQRGRADPDLRLHLLPILGPPAEPSGSLPDRFRCRARRCYL
jgi:hypothetical protein